MTHTEVSQPTKECPRPELWRMYDDNSAEVEVGDFIRSLIETVKPKLVVETGTHLGRTTAKIAASLNHIHIVHAACNTQKGKLITCDPNVHLEAVSTVDTFCDYVEFRQCSSLDLKVDEPIDILFCDSDPRIRMKEVSHFWDNLHPHSLILIHDVNSGCHNELRQELLGWKDRLSVVMLPTPRGLAICQKISGQ